MEKKPKKNDEEPKKEKQLDEKDIDDLKHAIEKLRDMQKKEQKQQKKNRKQPILAIEFGGVFHRNRYINLIFCAIVNFFFAYFIIEIFSFAEYHGQLYVLLLLMLIYTIIEEIYKNIILRHYFSLIIKSFGTVFFAGYLLIFFVLDQYVFTTEFNFHTGTLLAFFVIIFAVVRYLFSTSVRRYLRRK